MLSEEEIRVAYVQRSDLVLGKGDCIRVRGVARGKGIGSGLTHITNISQHFPSHVNPSPTRTHTYADPTSITLFATCFQRTQYSKHPHRPSPKPLIASISHHG
jgi:hypothetical protein